MSKVRFQEDERRWLHELWHYREIHPGKKWPKRDADRAEQLKRALKQRELDLQDAARRPKGPPHNGGWDVNDRGRRFKLIHGGRLREPWAHPSKWPQDEDGGQVAVKYALSMVGKVETGYNDAPWLRSMERDLLHAGYQLDWMIPGQPYCGFGVLWAWMKAGKKLPAGAVYTPNICASSAYGHKIPSTHAHPGALVVFDFNGGGADHVALARGPARNGRIPTVEFNTSPGSGGSQANGGGVWKRERPTGLILCVRQP